jgi:flagellar biosynthesis GTPase FlhF
MDKKTKLVLELLKTRANALGFNKEELEGAATAIASNLGVDDDATDEALNAAADKAVAVYFPILELSQKNANRIITKNKEEREKAEAEAKKKAEEEAARKAAEEAEAKKKAEEEAAAKKAEEERKAAEEAARKAAEEAGFQKFLDSELFKNMKQENENLSKQAKDLASALKKQQEEAKKQMEEFIAFRNEFNTMKADRLKATRESRLDELVKDAGVYGKRIKENYGLMTFNTDEDFEKFLGGVEADIKAFNQERADKGLDRLGKPAEGEEQHEPGKVEPMTEAEAAALAAIL